MAVPSDDLTVTNSKNGVFSAGGSGSGLIYNWREITDQFKSSCDGLPLGQLVHDSDFGLFEAMSAIEMMDPKMDAGMRCNRRAKKPYTFQTAKETLHLRLNETSYKEKIAIFDHTMARFVTWLEGHTLAQTVFTNLYLHSPHEIEEPFLKTHSIATLKLIDIIKDIISDKANSYEEEDFQPLTYSFYMAKDIPENKAGAMLREAEDELQKVVRATKSRADSDMAQENDEALALYARIRFYRQFYMSLVSLLKNEVSECQRYLNGAAEQMPTIKATLILGQDVEADEDGNIVGFEKLANQRLLPPTFPRSTHYKTVEEGVEYFFKLVQRLITATTVVQHTSFQSVIVFFNTFSRQLPCALSRAFLQILYQPLFTLFHAPLNQPSVQSSANNQIQFSFKELLKESCKSFLAPDPLTQASVKGSPYSSPQVKAAIDDFFHAASRPIGMMLQTFGHNRARQRDKMSVLIDEFSAVQEEADKLDGMLNEIAAQMESSSNQQSAGQNKRTQHLWFSTWLLYYVLRLMTQYLLVGFELELYAVHEYPYILWYLFELLYPWTISCLNRADAYLVAHEQAVEAKVAKDKGKSSNKKKGKAAGASKRKVRPFAKEIATYEGTAALCAGYYRVIVALRNEKKIVIPNPKFDKESVRYEHRFGCFANLFTPPIMPYAQFAEIYNHTSKISSLDLLRDASKDFVRSKTCFENIYQSVTYITEKSQRESTQLHTGFLIKSEVEELEAAINLNKNNFVVTSILTKDLQNRKVNFEMAEGIFPHMKLAT